jgi:hypothetical protein
MNTGRELSYWGTDISAATGLAKVIANGKFFIFISS